MGYLVTGIETLDRLLGGRGFREGTTILIRGAAGTGKTTLAFQIALNALRLAGDNYSVVYAAMEEDPDVALSRIFESLELHRQRPEEPPSSAPAARRFEDVAAGDNWYDFLRRYPAPRFNAMCLLGFWFEHQSSGLGQLYEMLWSSLVREEGARNLLVIDGLNGLISGLQTRFPKADDRLTAFAVLRSFDHYWRSRPGRPTVICTAEEVAGSPTASAESYLADVVVELRAETVELKFPLTERGVGTWTKKPQTHLFCRVAKARGLANQRRASCYALVGGYGLKFFPTYAAEGMVSLFAENTPQLNHIASIRSIDIPSFYPGVDVQEFERTGLQRIFAVQRHAERIPPRRPLYLSNIDEYWVEVLGREGQLQPIPPTWLHPGSLPCQGPTHPVALHHNEVIKELRAKTGPNGVPFYWDDRGNFLAVPYIGNVGMMVYRKKLLREVGRDAPPETWEDLRKICLQLKTKKLPHKFLIETQTYDTLMATALELWWSNGVYWRTSQGPSGRLVVDLRGSSFQEFVRPIDFLARLIHEDGIVPSLSSVDPSHASGSDPDGKADWVFARHWFSTWVDVMTRLDDNGQPVARFEPGEAIGIAPIPVFRRRRREFPTREACPHHSAWGEWFLAIQRGSENVEMGVDLINNLITARKLNELAFSGAGLPLMEQSYVSFGHAVCPWTDLTFNEIRETFLAGAKSRIEFADYRKVGRLFYGAINAILTNPSVVGESPDPPVSAILESSLKELDPGFDPRPGRAASRGDGPHSPDSRPRARTRPARRTG